MGGAVPHSLLQVLRSSSLVWQLVLHPPPPLPQAEHCRQHHFLTVCGIQYLHTRTPHHTTHTHHTTSHHTTTSHHYITPLHHTTPHHTTTPCHTTSHNILHHGIMGFEQEMGFCRMIKCTIGTSCNWMFQPRRTSSTVELRAETSSYNVLLCCV